MPPPDNGNVKIPFTELVALEKIEAGTYRSKELAFAPAGGNRTYGGHVYMQSCYAASQTVGKDFVLHVSTANLPRPRSAILPEDFELSATIGDKSRTQAYRSHPRM